MARERPAGRAETIRVSWISDTFAEMKRVIQLDADVARLHRAVEKADAIVMDHEKRLIRIETMIDLSRAAGRLPPR
jgi:hypothetical protein